MKHQGNYLLFCLTTAIKLTQQPAVVQQHYIAKPLYCVGEYATVLQFTSAAVNTLIVRKMKQQHTNYQHCRNCARKAKSNVYYNMSQVRWQTPNLVDLHKISSQFMWPSVQVQSLGGNRITVVVLWTAGQQVERSILHQLHELNQNSSK